VTGAIGGIWAAVPTPISASLEPDAQRALPYYRDLLANGCDGLNVFGTTGEAMSFSANQRLEYLERLAQSGLPVSRLMAGSGAASLDDAARLMRGVLDCGFAAALAMPPFFLRDASDDGIAAFFEALFERAQPPRGSVLLYSFPRMSGISLHATLVERIVGNSGGSIAGIKDSSNDVQLQSELAARLPGFAILPGSESDLREARGRGAAGVISGSVALWAPLAKRVFDTGDEDDARKLRAKRAALDGMPLVPAMRYLIAMQRDDPQWERAMPPQRRLTQEERQRLEGLISASAR
jgi:4-hydroxy-tetrahydrodipicolinate synthase